MWLSLEWQLFELLKEKTNAQIYLLKDLTPIQHGNGFAVFEFGKLPNVTICRHRTNQDLRWSHHEKLDVIDRSVAFVGGIDLCLGRWDTSAHIPTDNYPCHPGVSGEIDQAANPGKKYCQWVGKDYRNTFLEATDLDKHLDDVLKDIKQDGKPIRTTIPRLPWHDVACVFTG